MALGISVWAVWWTGAVARRRDRLEIRGVAVAIYPEIEMLEVTTQDVRDRVALIIKRDGLLVGQSVAAGLQVATHIQAPPMLDRNTDKLFILGDVAGPSCLQLVRLIRQYNDAVENIVSCVPAMSAGQWIEAVGHLEDHLGLLDKVIKKCEREVRPIHDAIKG